MEKRERKGGKCVPMVKLRLYYPFVSLGPRVSLFSARLKEWAGPDTDGRMSWIEGRKGGDKGEGRGDCGYGVTKRKKHDGFKRKKGEEL